MFYVKKIKRKCGVRGCKNTESYAISKSREMGNSIIACRECLAEALNTIDEQNKPVTPVVEEQHEEVTEPVIEPVTEETEQPVTPVSEDKPKRQREK